MVKNLSKISICLAILGILISCSSHYRSSDSYNRMEEIKKIVEKRSNDQDCTIKTIDKKSFVGKNIRFKDDDIEYIDQESNSKILPLSSISYISIRSSLLDIFTGTIIGAAIGSTVGYLVTPKGGGLETLDSKIRSFCYITTIGGGVGTILSFYDTYSFSELKSNEPIMEEYDDSAIYQKETQYLEE